MATDQHAARRAFARIASAPEQPFALERGGLLIAAEDCPGLDMSAIAAWSQRIDALAEGVAQRAGGSEVAAERVAALRDHLYAELGFRGNRDDYYDPRNSHLHQVLERRLGLPITLAVVCLAVAERLGWPMEGIGAPGHFLMRYVAEPCIVVDPFTGEVLSTEEPREGRVPAAATREILARMLRNLKQIRLSREEWSHAVACCDRILLLDATAADEYRDRGALWERLGSPATARIDYERFLQIAPGDPTAEAIRRRLAELPEASAVIH